MNKKSVLVIVPFENIYPPKNGGMQRCFHILHQLSNCVNLTVIIHQDIRSFSTCIKYFPTFSNVNIISTQDVERSRDLFSLLPDKFEQALRYRWYKKQLKGPADGNFLKYYSILKKLLQKEIYDYIILENLGTINAVSIIRRYCKTAKIIYDAHNVDVNLAKAAFSRGEASSRRVSQIALVEQNMSKNVDAVFTCSENDATTYKSMNNDPLKTVVIPNGVSIAPDLSNNTVQTINPDCILFCGTLWSIPNAEALDWFCNLVFPRIKRKKPTVSLIVVGSGKLPDKYSNLTSMPEINFAGNVDDLRPWYNKAALTIAPLLRGSGTRLKILESMAMGVPVVATRIGAEGIEYLDRQNILIANDQIDFADAVVELLNNRDQRNSIACNALQLVREKYDWDVIGRTMCKFLMDN